MIFTKELYIGTQKISLINSINIAILLCAGKVSIYWTTTHNYFTNTHQMPSILLLLFIFCDSVKILVSFGIRAAYSFRSQQTQLIINFGFLSSIILIIYFELYKSGDKSTFFSYRKVKQVSILSYLTRYIEKNNRSTDAV